MKRVICIIIILASYSTLTFAQRLIPQQYTLEIGFNTIDFQQSIGGEVSFAQYKYNGEWNITLSYGYENYGQDINCHSTLLKGGYEFFLIHNYKKSIILSAGGSALIGYEHIPSPITEGLVITSTSSFIYGVAPVISLDFFFHRYIALGLHFSPMLAFGSTIGIWRPETGLSIKICLN